MEEWQRSHIRENLPNLASLTRFSSIVEAVLKQHGVLSDEECELLNAIRRNQGDFAQSGQLYSILETKSNGYVSLLEALREARQTGALEIIEAGAHKGLPKLQIKYWGHVKTLKEVFPLLTEVMSANLMQCTTIREEYLRILKRKSSNLVLNGNIPSARPLYISRRVSSCIYLNPEVFKATNCSDVFVFKKPISRREISDIANGNPTCSSRVLNIQNFRFIYLCEDDHFHDIVNTVAAPVHLISKQENNYLLLTSTRRTSLIDKYRLENISYSESLSEDEFVHKLVFSELSKCFCICDLPGMGKTWFFENIGRKVQTINPGMTVFLVPLSNLSVPFANQSIGAELEFLVNYQCSSKLLTSVLLYLHREHNHKFLFLLDGLDEVSDSNIDRLSRFLRALATSSSHVYLGISSRPHLRMELEELFEVFSLFLVPFWREEQTSALVQHWANVTDITEDIDTHDKFAAFQALAQQCIRNCETFETTLLGTPLKCYMLANIYELHAKRLLSVKNLQDDFVIKSTCDLYVLFIETQVAKRKELDQQQNIELEDIYYEYLLNFHTDLALKLICPEVIAEDYTETRETSPSYILSLGVLITAEGYHNMEPFKFIHRSFAEYFVARFFANYWKKVTIDESFRDGSIERDFVKIIMKKGRRSKEFRSQLLPQFIDSQLGNTQFIRRRPLDFNANLEKQVLAGIICCIKTDLGSLLGLLLSYVGMHEKNIILKKIQQCGAGIFQESSMERIMNLIAMNGSVYLANVFVKYFQEDDRNYIIDYCKSCSTDRWEYVHRSTLWRAAQNNVELFVYFLDLYKFDGSCLLRYLMKDRKPGLTDILSYSINPALIEYLYPVEAEFPQERRRLILDALLDYDRKYLNTFTFDNERNFRLYDSGMIQYLTEIYLFDWSKLSFRTKWRLISQRTLFRPFRDSLQLFPLIVLSKARGCSPVARIMLQMIYILIIPFVVLFLIFSNFCVCLT